MIDPTDQNIILSVAHTAIYGLGWGTQQDFIYGASTMPKPDSHLILDSETNTIIA